MDLAVNVAFPAITAAFGLATREIRWVVVCYVLTYASLTLAFGRLGDLIGHRRVFAAGLIVSTIAFVLCALAPTYGLLLVARVGQGLGTALVLSCAPALITLLYTEHRRTEALSIYGAMFAASSVAAPLLGGASIALLGHSGVFWFRAPIAMIALLMLPLLRAVPRSTPTRMPDRSDIVGSSLLAVSLALVLITVTLAHSTNDGALLLSCATSGILVVAALVLQQRRAPEPILPHAAIRDLDFVIPNLVAITVHFVAFAVPLLVPFYLAEVGGYSPAQGGAVLLLSPVGMLLGSAAASMIVRAIGARTATLLGGMIVAVGTIVIGTWGRDTGLAVVFTGLLLQGFGLGLFQVTYTDVVVGALPKESRGVAGSLTMVARTIGVVTAATMLTAALASVEQTQLGAGADTTAAFAQAFSRVFLTAGASLVAIFAVTSLRRGPWRTTRSTR
jgi:MFS family permease